MKYEAIQLEDLEALPRFEFDRGADYEVCSYPWDLRRVEAYWTIGHRDEAWRMLNVLLLKYTKGIPDMVPHYHAKVYKTMSKILNFEGRPIHALRMAIAAYYCQLAHYFMIHSYVGLLEALSESAIQKALKLRAKKANATELLPSIQMILTNSVRQFPNYDVGIVLNEIDKLDIPDLPHARA